MTWWQEILLLLGITAFGAIVALWVDSMAQS